MKELPKFTPPTNPRSFTEYLLDLIMSFPMIGVAFCVVGLTIYFMRTKQRQDAIEKAIYMVFFISSLTVFLAVLEKEIDDTHLLAKEKIAFQSALYEGYSKEFLISYRISPEVGYTEKLIATDLLNDRYKGWSINTTSLNM